MIFEAEIIAKINQLKSEMGALWDERKKTDYDILELSIQIDQLLNQYNWLTIGLDK